MFADRYIDRNIVYPAFIKTPVPPSLSMIVMIPCLNEPEIIRTLESLWDCEPVTSVCEVIVVVNDSECSRPEIKQFNQETYDRLMDWKSKNDRPDLILHPIYASNVNAKHAGAGMARKIGMDEAIRRFNCLNRQEGIIISLDADCLVSANYLKSIESYFVCDKTHFTATINFSHRIDETGDPRQRKGIRLYEDYLRYYKQAHDFTGFPNSIYTIGSAFAVRAGAYVKQGGMNRRQAGEDFYFLNKLTNLGTVGEINEACVFPSARVSDRVPFGTGAAMTKWMNEDGDLTLTYNFAAFKDLKSLFDSVDGLFRIDNLNIEIKLAEWPVSVQEYLAIIDFSEKLQEINRNSASLLAFRKRFFQYFDAFVIMRFLNWSHPGYYPRQDLYEAINQLQEQTKNKE
jgi:hypothetical protein